MPKVKGSKAALAREMGDVGRFAHARELVEAIAG
jgi:hypothetical protein